MTELAPATQRLQELAKTGTNGLSHKLHALRLSATQQDNQRRQILCTTCGKGTQTRSRTEVDGQVHHIRCLPTPAKASQPASQRGAGPEVKRMPRKPAAAAKTSALEDVRAALQRHGIEAEVGLDVAGAEVRVTVAWSVRV